MESGPSSLMQILEPFSSRTSGNVIVFQPPSAGPFPVDARAVDAGAGDPCATWPSQCRSKPLARLEPCQPAAIHVERRAVDKGGVV